MITARGIITLLVLAVLFACFCILASFGIGNMSQINSIAGNMNAAFHLPYLATGLALMVVTALIVIGGLKRVAAVTEKLVPLMALFYVAGALIIVVMHAGNIPAALAALVNGFVYPVQAKFANTLGATLKNAALIAFSDPAVAISAAVLNAIPTGLLLKRPELFVKTSFLWLLLGVAVIAWCNWKMMDAVFQKYYTPEEVKE